MAPRDRLTPGPMSSTERSPLGAPLRIHELTERAVSALPELTGRTCSLYGVDGGYEARVWLGDPDHLLRGPGARQPEVQAMFYLALREGAMEPDCAGRLVMLMAAADASGEDLWRKICI